MTNKSRREINSSSTSVKRPASPPSEYRWARCRYERRQTDRRVIDGMRHAPLADRAPCQRDHADLRALAAHAEPETNSSKAAVELSLSQRAWTAIERCRRAC